jgi:hypothetical protein
LTHPMSTAFLPASDALRAPHIVVRFKSPKKSSKVCLSERSYQPSAITKDQFCLSFRTALSGEESASLRDIRQLCMSPFTEGWWLTADGFCAGGPKKRL